MKSVSPIPASFDAILQRSIHAAGIVSAACDDHAHAGDDRVQADDDRAHAGDDRVHADDDRVQAGDDSAHSAPGKSQAGVMADEPVCRLHCGIQTLLVFELRNIGQSHGNQ